MEWLDKDFKPHGLFSPLKVLLISERGSGIRMLELSGIVKRDINVKRQQ
jgi:hypothetical protein